MESFEHCHGCVVSPEKVGLPLSLIVEDSTHNRPLRLSVTTEMLGGTALKVIEKNNLYGFWSVMYNYLENKEWRYNFIYIVYAIIT